MFHKTILLIITLGTSIGAEDDKKFRFDYSFSEKADGWLKFHRVPSTWNDAKIRCSAEGAILASPLTNQLKEAILKHVSNDPVNDIFTGVHSLMSYKDYASLEGIPESRLPLTWSTGEPKGNTKNCLVMKTKSNGTIADVKCSNTLPYVCYKKRTELTITECGTHDREYKLDARTGSCYKFHRWGKVWSIAYMTCIAEGGHLAVINSVQEHIVLKELFDSVEPNDIFTTNTAACYVGYRDMKNGQYWMTIHGETLTQAGFDWWGHNQPDNARFVPEGEACGSIFRNGLLNDIYCGRTLAFICEKNPKSLEISYEI